VSEETRPNRRPLGGELARSTRDLTAEARGGRLEPVRCRDEEIARLIDILLRHGKNNPVLVGAAGVGKTAVVEGFAERIAAGDVPVVLRDVRVLSLDHVALLAGTTYRGQYEEKIRSIVQETTMSPDVILFIDELHNLIGQGTALGAAMDAANMLKPALVRGDFRVIGATTDDEYDRYVAGDPALERRFQKVLVRELGVPETLDILRARKERLERHHNVVIADEALVASIALTDQYVTDRHRPDKAIDALDEACAHTQAVAKYSSRAEGLMRERVKKLRGNRPRPPAGGTPAEGDEKFRQMAENGMDALERFGTELEALLTGAPRAGTPPVPRPAPMPMQEEPVTVGALDTELARVLVEEGVVVRAHDVERVVSLMAGKPVTWER
jgi:ATP-dependent Clp protease ATP-binding subunit ClpA